MKLLALAILLSASCASSSQAQALHEGKVVAIGQDVNLASLHAKESRKLLFKYEATTNASFMRIRFSNIVSAGESRFAIAISGRGGNLLHSIDSAVFLKSNAFWTDVLPTDLVRIEFAGKAENLKFRVEQVAVQTTAAVPFDVKDPDQREKVEKYRTHEHLWKASRAVAKLSFIKDGSSDACTGFLIDIDHLLTNFHCVNTDETCSSARAMFGYEEIGGVVRREPQINCEKVVAADPSLDFAVLKLAGSPGQRWGFIELTRRPPHKDEQAYLIHHSYGDPKQITRLDCFVKNPVTDGASKDTDLGHECDCVRGASGSPLLGDDFKVIGLHHLGFSLDPRWSDANRAVRITKIMDKLGR